MSTNLPEQVRKQSAEIQALYQNLEMGKETSTEVPAKVVPPKEAKATETVSETTPPAEKEREKAGTSSKKKEADDFEQKYKTLQGMYNVDVPKLRATNQDLEQRLLKMEGLLADLGGAPEAAKAPAVSTGSLITKADMEEYGDSLDVMRRVSQEELQPLFAKLSSIEASINSLNTDVRPKVDQVFSSQVQTKEAQFWEAIEREVPDWKKINVNDDFATWLFNSDPMTGTVRQDILDAAQKKGDAQKVIYIFKAWMGETGYDSGTSEAEVAHAESETELESQVAPGKGRGGGHASKGTKPKFTRAEIGSFYSDVAKGKFKGRDAERIKIEADIFEAQQEGRVT